MSLLACFRVAGTSMLPAFRPGDYVLVSQVPYFLRSPRSGDVVVCRHPATRRPLLKRIAAVQHGVYHVAGDNAAESSDSRHFGAISNKEILGKVCSRIRA